jgi:hypothetical protein
VRAAEGRFGCICIWPAALHKASVSATEMQRDQPLAGTKFPKKIRRMSQSLRRILYGQRVSACIIIINTVRRANVCARTAYAAAYTS